MFKPNRFLLLYAIVTTDNNM